MKNNKQSNKEYFSWEYVNYPEENNWRDDGDIEESPHYLIKAEAKESKSIIKNDIRIYLLSSQEYDIIIEIITNALNSLVFYVFNA